MSFEGAIAQIDAAAAYVAELGKVGAVTVEVSAESAAKLEYLRASKRDFFAATPQLRAVAAAALKKAHAAQRAGRSAKQTLWGMTVAVRSFILDRFLKNGGDVRMAPLKKSTIQRKLQRGQPALLALATKALYNDLVQRPWRIRQR